MSNLDLLEGFETKGIKHAFDVILPQVSPKLFYEHPNGSLYQGDSIKWLKSLDSGSTDLIFADPPYNIKKAEWDTFESQQAYVDWSLEWIEQAERVLKADGSLYVCGFSEILADIKLPAQRFFRGCRWLVWHYKNKANMGSDWGRSHESLCILGRPNLLS
jgi:site-specific DNA-methyltransferase (adenine-specific)